MKLIKEIETWIEDDLVKHWYDRCKNNNTECESGRGMNRLCSDCQADKIDEAKSYAEEQEWEVSK